MNGSIQLGDIKPHGGEKWKAFEELSFHLFASQFQTEGEAVRREGTGGDGGLEGYVCDSADREIIGLQAKFYDKKLGATQWRHIDGSVCTALRGNMSQKSLKRYVVAMPRNLTQPQRKEWAKRKKSWNALAKKLGFKKAPEFELWDDSYLQRLLLRTENRGRLIYWFDVPNFDRDRCCQLTDVSIAGLEDRYIERSRPGLHARTNCEEGIHRFLRTERFRREFNRKTHEAIHEVCHTPWRTKTDWSKALKASAKVANQKLDKIVRLLGNGVDLSAKIGLLSEESNRFAAMMEELQGARRKELTELTDKVSKPDPATISTHRRDDGPQEQCRREFGSPRLTNWSYWLSASATIADDQFLLITGEFGTGKSHLLAETCRRFNESGGTALLIEAGKLGGTDAPWNQLLHWVDVSVDVRDFLAALSALADTTPLCGLICIDAINESPNRELWLNHLHSFAEELRPFPNLKLIISCRSDFMELCVPEVIRARKADGWGFLRHDGLNESIGDAVSAYLKAYNVRGATSQLFSNEFRRPLMLKIFCEAFENRRVPPGTLSLATVLAKYVERKCRNIRDRIGCAPPMVRAALDQIAKSVVESHSSWVPESQVRQICLLCHSAPDEAKSLFRSLLSEGILHESIHQTAGSLGSMTEIRFNYERVWDYFVSLILTPANAIPADPALEQLRDIRWQSRNPGILSMLAIRLAEESHIELHDLLGVQANSREAELVDESFLDTLEWRTRQSCTPRTEELFEQLERQRGNEFIFSFATHEDHPWNIEFVHQRLMAMPLAKRDQKWTRWVNETFDNERYLEDSDGPFEKILKLTEAPATTLLSDSQIALCATTLAWLLTSTFVEKRIRVSLALANVLRGRLNVATELFVRFKEVDDPYVLEMVLFAAASAAIHADQRDHALGRLAKAVHESIFSGETVNPHLLIRHYASLICDEAHRKHVLPKGCESPSYRPPFGSKWPKIMSPKTMKTMEEQVKSDYEKNSALREVIGSTATHADGYYGDFGRYRLESAVHRFQRQRLHRPRLRGSSWDTHFDAQLARRFVVQRVIQLGLNPNARDHSSTNESYMQRPAIERLGKKYQWIAFYEILGYLSDHFHLSNDYWDESVSTFESARDLNPPDLLDPFGTQRTEQPKDEEDDFGWDFAAPSLPWWQPMLSPYPKPLTGHQRRTRTSQRETTDPKSLLRVRDPKGQEWLVLDGAVEFGEPIENFARSGLLEGAELAKHLWSLNSFVVPSAMAQYMAKIMEEPRHDNRMCPSSPKYRAELRELRTYPEGINDFFDECGKVVGLDLGAWFTNCEFDNGYESATQIKGTIPSPQLANLLKLRWTGNSMDFAGQRGGNVLFKNVGSARSPVALVSFAEVSKALAKAELELIWRVFGWKWCSSRRPGEFPQREYWCNYRMTADGVVHCLGGGTWLVPDDETREDLPWTTTPIR